METKGVKVQSMAISPDETWLVCSMENNQLIAFPFQNLDMVKPNEVPRDMIVQVKVSFDYLNFIFYKEQYCNVSSQNS